MIKNEGEQQVLRNAIVPRNWRRGSRLRTPRSRRDRIAVIFISLQVFSFLDSKRKASYFAYHPLYLFFFGWQVRLSLRVTPRDGVPWSSVPITRDEWVYKKKSAYTFEQANSCRERRIDKERNKNQRARFTVWALFKTDFEIRSGRKDSIRFGFRVWLKRKTQVRIESGVHTENYVNEYSHRQS